MRSSPPTPRRVPNVSTTRGREKGGNCDRAAWCLSLRASSSWVIIIIITTIMSLRHEPRTLVATTVSVYRSSLVDLRRSRTVHHVDTFPCLPYDLRANVPGAIDCQAVHYGQCVPVLVRVGDLTDPTISVHVDPQYQQQYTPAKKSPRSGDLSFPMLALATGSSSPPSSSPTTPTSHVHARPLSAVSSSILSAVEKFELKNAGRLNRITDGGHKSSLVNNTLLSHAEGGETVVNSSLRKTVMAKTDKVNGGAKESGPPEAKTNTGVSGILDPLATPLLPKYDSCTWPSKRTSPTSKAKKSEIEQVESVVETSKPKNTVSVEKLAPAANHVGKLPATKITLSDLTDGKVVEKSPLKEKLENAKNEVKSCEVSPTKTKKVQNDKKGVVDNGIGGKAKRSMQGKTTSASPTSNGPSSVSSITKGSSLVPSSSPSASVTRPNSDDLLQEELEKILNAVSIQDPIKTPSENVSATPSTPAGRCETIPVQDDQHPSANKDSCSNGPSSLNNGNSKFPVQKVVSPVDFAKSRFQGTQQVTSTKNRFENGQIHNSLDQWRPEWLPLQGLSLGNSPVNSNGNEAGMVQAAVDALKRGEDVIRQSQSEVQLQQQPTCNHVKKASSPEPFPSPSGSTLNPSLPHPKLTNTQKQHIRERATSPTGYSAHVPIRPFLTKGSVAERVLIFERCPTVTQSSAVTSPLVKIKQHAALAASSQSKVQVKDKENKESTVSSNNTKNASTKSLKNVHIPKFYFPYGRPPSSKEIEAILQRLVLTFSNLENGVATKEQFGIIAKACELPLYWKMPLFLAVGGDKKGYIQKDAFIDYWKKVLVSCHDDASKFMRILTKQSRNYMLPEDFVPFLQDVVNTHPGLTFLKEAIEFHSRYIHTVIARIYYCVNRSWTGRITLAELRKSNFLQVVALLEEEEDINQITEFFSYEHFYVIYCKFWELDKDHDLYIDKSDLSRHNDHAISLRMIDRIFSGAVTRGRTQKEQKMSYTEFVWFLMSEEDKRHPTSIEYWFRCMDLDGDGYLSMYELEYFYEEQLQRMEVLGIETLPFKDCLCQMLDMIRPKVKGMISLSDLKNCRMTPIFFDTFFNLEKYLDHEQRDPFATQRDHDIEGPDISDWDRYAAEEYEFLVAEEGTNEPGDDLAYDDEEDELSSNLAKLLMANNSKQTHIPNSVEVDEEYTDYADSDDYQY